MNREDNIYYNASGCADPTAAEAIRRVMSMTVNPKAGEIWSLDEGKKILIIHNANGIINYTAVIGADNGYTDIEVGGYFINSAMLAYTWADRAKSFVSVMSDDEFDKVLDTISKTLGLCGPCLEAVRENEKKVAELEKERVRLNAEIVGLLDRAESQSAKELNKYKTAAGLYKELYEILLSKFMGGK